MHPSSSTGSVSVSLGQVKLAEQDLKVLIFSWNVGNAAPKESELQHWLEDGGGGYDLIVVGTQENDYKGDGAAAFTSDDAVVEDSSDEEDEDKAKKPGGLFHQGIRKLSTPKEGEGAPSQAEWDVMITHRLGSDYGAVAHIVLWEMRLTVYALRKHLKGPEACIKHVVTSKEATGFAGVGGNKGGLLVGLCFGPTRLCFVSCHLTAHAHKNDDRNANCREILSNTEKKFGNPRLDATHDYDHVFWLGDLNYRVDLNLDPAAAAWRTSSPVEGCGTKTDPEMHARVLEMVEARQFGELLACDQLRRSRAEGEAFAGFVEGEADFAPTFKVKREGGSHYNQQRIPSYCDRVLWKSMPALRPSIRQTLLRSVPAVSTSDHKPVVAAFAIQPSPQPAARPRTSARRSPHNLSSGSRPGRRREELPPLPAVVVRISEVRIDTLLETDLMGGCDPRLFFFSSPPGLLTDGKTLLSTKPRRVERGEGAQGLTLSERELPLLLPAVRSIHDLQRATLILSLSDEDKLSADDEMGTVLVSLAHPGGAEALESGGVDTPLTSYKVPVSSKLVLYNATKGMGTLTATLTVTYGDGVADAIKQAEESGVGSEAVVVVPGAGDGCCTIS